MPVKKQSNRICSIYITTSTLLEAKKITQYLLKNRFVACGNIFKISSLFWWDGKIESCPEYAVILKTKKQLVKTAIKEIKKIHSYEVPCIVVWDILDGNPDYLKWVEKETK